MKYCLIFKINKLKYLLLITLIISCTKKNTPPSIKTLDYTNLNSQSVMVNVELINPDNLNISVKGVTWFTESGFTTPTLPFYRTEENTNSNTFTSTVYGLLPNTTYYLKAYFMDKAGVHFGNEISITTPPSETSQFNPLKTYGIVNDIEGNSYKTIEIGNQTWMAENLKVTKFNDGTPITQLYQSNPFNNNGNPAWCYYNDSIGVNQTYGKLYNINIPLDNKNICPTGWHIPSDQDFNVLKNNISIVNPAGALSSTGYNFWSYPNTVATNETGFSAVPGGIKSYAVYTGLGGTTEYWLKGGVGIYVFGFSSGNSEINLFPENNSNTLGRSIRCIKD
jgi:uncharacterized protein (TIGR02145 family)